MISMNNATLEGSERPDQAERTYGVGYLIILARLYERDRFQRYVAALPPVYQAFGGRYLAIGGPSQVQRRGRDGEPMSMVISLWPSFQHVLQFWRSAEYQQVKALREGTGDFDVFACPGVAPSEDAAQAFGLLLDSHAPRASAEAAVLAGSDGLHLLASHGPGEGEVLEGQRLDQGIALFAAASLSAALDPSERWPSTPSARWWVLPRLGG